MAQLLLSRPEKAHGSGETSNTMADRGVQSDSLVLPDPLLVHLCRPNFNLGTSIWQHKASGVLASSRLLWPIFKNVLKWLSVGGTEVVLAKWKEQREN